MARNKQPKKVRPESEKRSTFLVKQSAADKLAERQESVGLTAEHYLNTLIRGLAEGEIVLPDVEQTKVLYYNSQLGKAARAKIKEQGYTTLLEAVEVAALNHLEKDYVQSYIDAMTPEAFIERFSELQRHEYQLKDDDSRYAMNPETTMMYYRFFNVISAPILEKMESLAKEEFVKLPKFTLKAFRTIDGAFHIVYAGRHVENGERKEYAFPYNDASDVQGIAEALLELES